MDRKSILVPVLLGALGAVLAVGLLGLGRAEPALAGGGGTGIPEKNLLAVTTGAPGDDGNRLVMAETSVKRLAVYRILPNGLRLIAVRSYVCDMKFEDAGEVPGGGYSYEKAREAALKNGVTEEALKVLPRGREMLLTTDGLGADGKSDGNRIVLVNPEEKRILVYRLHGNSILLIGARRFDDDLALEYTKGVLPGNGYTRDDVLNLLKRLAEEAAAGPRRD